MLVFAQTSDRMELSYYIINCSDLKEPQLHPIWSLGTQTTFMQNHIIKFLAKSLRYMSNYSLRGWNNEHVKL